MQEMQRPDGSILTELFTGEQVKDGGAERRRKMLEALGYKFRALTPVEQKPPHQGSREMARRVKQILKAAANKTPETA